MSELILTQRRYVTTVSGVTKYSIQISVTRGDTPALSDSPMTPHVFVMTAGKDELSDSFARVASIADLDLVQSLRYVALERGHTEYRSSKATLAFSDLDTAIAAIPVLKDRVNNLVKVWRQAQTDFINLGDVYTLPLEGEADVSLRASLESAYKAAAASRVAAEKAQADAQVSYEAAQSAVDLAKALKDVHCSYSDQFAQLNGLANSDLVPSSPATALSVAAAALNSAVGYFARCTRVADGKRGVVGAGSTASSVSVVPSDFTDNDPNYENKTLVVVTFAFDGHKEVRFVTNVASGSLSVSPDFGTAPVEDTDKWELHFLTDYLPINDYGSTAAAAARVQAALDAMSGNNSLASLLSAFSTDATTNCGTYTDTHATQLDLEQDSLVSVEKLKAKKDAAQAVENLAAAALLDLCPTADLGALLK